MKNKHITLILFITAVSILLGVKFGFHELWKDEWQAWMVARDLDFWSMLQFLNYEGHPAVWYSYLKVWTLFGGNDEIMLQIAHSLTIVGALYVFVMRFKMPWLFKLLMVFSYFFFFEYGIVNRGYAMVMLLTFISVDALRLNKYTFLAISLFLLCQTEVYGLMIAGSLGFYYLIDQEENGTSEYLRMLKTLPIVALVAGIIVFIIVVYPRGNTDDFTRAYIQQPFDIGLISSSFQGIFANTFGIGLVQDTKLFGVTSLGIIYSLFSMLMSFFVLRKHSSVWQTWLFFVLGFFIFNIAIFNGGVRHLGMGFVMFAALIELSDIKIDWREVTTYMVLLLLVPPVIHNVRGVAEELNMPYSNAQKAGLYIKEAIPQNVPVVAINKFETAPVGAYADRAFYELPSGESFTYFKWLEKVYIPTESELRLFAQFKKVGGLVIVSPTLLDTNRFPNVQLGKTFDQKSMKRENYYIYTLVAK